MNSLKKKNQKKSGVRKGDFQNIAMVVSYVKYQN